MQSLLKSQILLVSAQGFLGDLGKTSGGTDSVDGEFKIKKSQRCTKYTHVIWIIQIWKTGTIDTLDKCDIY